MTVWENKSQWKKVIQLPTALTDATSASESQWTSWGVSNQAQVELTTNKGHACFMLHASVTIAFLIDGNERLLWLCFFCACVCVCINVYIGLPTNRKLESIIWMLRFWLLAKSACVCKHESTLNENSTVSTKIKAELKCKVGQEKKTQHWVWRSVAVRAQ